MAVTKADTKRRRYAFAAPAAQPRGVLILICRRASQGIASSGGRACEEPGPSSFAPLAIGLLPASMSGDNSPRLG